MTSKKPRKIHQPFFSVAEELKKQYVGISLPERCIISSAKSEWKESIFFPSLRIVVSTQDNSVYQVQKRADGCWYHCTANSQVYHKCATVMPSQYTYHTQGRDDKCTLMSTALDEALAQQVENIILEEA